MKKNNQINARWIIPLGIFVFALSVLRCTDYFTGPGPQPHYINGQVTHEVRFNVFGVLRPDTVETGLPVSFIQLETSFPMNDYPDSNDAADADVFLISTTDTQADTLQFTYSDLGVFQDTVFRRPDFFPIAGRTYGLVCHKDGYTTLTAETLIPDRPEIIPNSLHISSGKVEFTIRRDEMAGLYEAVLIGAAGNQIERFLPPKSGDTKMSIQISGDSGAPTALIVYAYDLNLAVYLTANISIKPNVYQSDFSTVENGYGCFGSLNVRKIPLAY